MSGGGGDAGGSAQPRSVRWWVAREGWVWLRRRRALQRGLDATVGGIFIALGVRLAVVK
jgi:threonine/homoserine/homoserine lactone efflux protein